MLTISTHTTAVEAHIVRGRLECEGIPAFVAFEHHVWAKWTLSLALGGVRVQVPASFGKEAAEVLKNIQEGIYESELKEEVPFSEPIRCPKCNSSMTENIELPWRLALFMMFMFSIPLPYTQHLMRCKGCSHRWIASEQRAYPPYLKLYAITVIGGLIYVLYWVWCHWCRLHCEQALCL